MSSHGENSIVISFDTSFLAVRQRLGRVTVGGEQKVKAAYPQEKRQKNVEQKRRVKIVLRYLAVVMCEGKK